MNEQQVLRNMVVDDEVVKVKETSYRNWRKERSKETSEKYKANRQRAKKTICLAKESRKKLQVT